MPHQIFGRNHFVLTGFGTYAEVDVFDSGLDDKAGADGAGFCAVNRIITGIDAGKIEVGTDGSGALKKYVTESVNAYLAPIREKRRALENDLDTIKDILHEGNKKANLIADATLNEVREAMNMLY